jgi:hypothetical protein
MKKRYCHQLLLLLVMLAAAPPAALSQTIHYSRQTQKIPVYDRMELVADIGGSHHLLVLNKKEAAQVHVFSKQLQLVGKKVLPLIYADGQDIRIISFKSFYYLYAHKRGSTKHELWKISANGAASSQTVMLEKLLDTAFKRKISVLQLTSREEQLVVMVHTYYEELKALATTIVRADEQFRALSSKSISFAFEQNADKLHQTELWGEHLYFLKSGNDTEKHSLELIRADLKTGKLFRKAFESEYDFTGGASFRQSADSGIILYSRVGRRLFVSKLDFLLNELLPVTFLYVKPDRSVAHHFMLLGGEIQQWFADLSAVRLRPAGSRIDAPSIYDIRSGSGLLRQGLSANENYGRQYGSGSFASGYSPDGRYYGNERNHYNPAPAPQAIRFSVFAANMKMAADSVFPNKKGPAIINASECLNIKLGQKSCLLLKQEFPRNRRGLVLVDVDGDHRLATRDIVVFEKYEYLLQQAQLTSDGTLIMPYAQKSETGLVRMAFDKTARTGN